eukprot:scaffold140698_cov33-Tisochrysis_lutea.AAC.1
MGAGGAWAHPRIRVGKSTSYRTIDGVARTRGTSRSAPGARRSAEEDQAARAGGGVAASRAPPMGHATAHAPFRAAFDQPTVLVAARGEAAINESSESDARTRASSSVPALSSMSSGNCSKSLLQPSQRNCGLREMRMSSPSIISYAPGVETLISRACKRGGIVTDCGRAKTYVQSG